MVTKRTLRKNTIKQLAVSGSISDNDIDDIISSLRENIESLPAHVQDLLMSSEEPTREGKMSYVMAAGWALGKFDYVMANPWKGTKSGWVASEGDAN